MPIQQASVTPADNLQSVVDSLTSPALVTLAPGDYILDDPLWLSRELTLRGAGMGLTRLRNGYGGHLIHVAGNVPLVGGERVPTRLTGDMDGPRIGIRLQGRRRLQSWFSGATMR